MPCACPAVPRSRLHRRQPDCSWTGSADGGRHVVSFRRPKAPEWNSPRVRLVSCSDGTRQAASCPIGSTRRDGMESPDWRLGGVPLLDSPDGPSCIGGLITSTVLALAILPYHLRARGRRGAVAAADLGGPSTASRQWAGWTGSCKNRGRTAGRTATRMREYGRDARDQPVLRNRDHDVVQ